LAIRLELLRPVLLPSSKPIQYKDKDLAQIGSTWNLDEVIVFRLNLFIAKARSVFRACGIVL
jgi:hypothetical protein